VRTSRYVLAGVAVAIVATVPPAGSLAAGQRTLLSAQDDRRREVALHGLGIDAYRIAKRVQPGKAVQFEFRADTTGTFRFYCSLTGADGRPHDEAGELVVRR
jgi:hypothetical protein